MLFSNLHGTTLFAFFSACALFQLNPNEWNKQTDGSWCEALKRSTAVDVTLTAFRCTSFRSACCLLLFLFVAECKTQTDKRQLMSLKQTRDASTVDVEHRTVYVVFWFLRSSTERGNSLQRCHNTCSDARHQRCLKGKLQVTRQVTSQVLCLAGLFSSFWCVCEGWKQFQLIK